MNLKIAAVQMKVSDDKARNLQTAARSIARLASQGADLIVLPEMFLCPYQTDLFHTYAEPAAGPAVNQLAHLAAKNHIWLVAGSIPERDSDGRVYNTSFVFDRDGRQIAAHRKAHLFDVDIKGGQYFKESDTLTPGQAATTFQTEYGPIGLCICYDFRFPELARRMVLDGAKLLLVPGAFNQTTGPAHWEVLFRSRAIDNQTYTLGCAPARNPDATYQSWGHSILVGPWGNVIRQLGQTPGSFLETIDLSLVDKVRRELPLLLHRRTEIY